MPIKIRKLPHSSKYRVWNGKKVVAKRTTKKNAEAQKRLILGLDHGMKLRKRKN